jgi:hypothetical protein
VARFHCNECNAYQAPTPWQQQRDMIGALTLLAESQLLPALAQEPTFVHETEGRGEDDDEPDDSLAERFDTDICK